MTEKSLKKKQTNKHECNRPLANNTSTTSNNNNNNNIQSILRVPTRPINQTTSNKSFQAATALTQTQTQITKTNSPSPDSPRSSNSLSSSSYYLDSCTTTASTAVTNRDHPISSTTNNGLAVSLAINSVDTDTDEIDEIDFYNNDEFDYNEKDIFEHFGGDQLSLSSLLTSSSASSCQISLNSASSSSLSSNLIASFRNNHTNSLTRKQPVSLASKPQNPFNK